MDNVTPKKKIGRPTKGDGVKKSFNVYLTQSMKDEIIKRDGSLTASLEKRHAELSKPKY